MMTFMKGGNADVLADRNNYTCIGNFGVKFYNIV